MKRITKKLKKNGGFTLAETLLAVLILLLVSVIVAEGMPAVRNVYEKVFIGANAQVLLSTTVTALRDELGTAWDVSVGTDNKSVTYFSASTGAQSKLYLDGNTIYITEYVEYDGLNTAVGSKDNTYALVSAAASTGNRKNDLQALFDSITCDKDKGIVEIKNLRVEHDGTAIAKMSDQVSDNVLKIQVLTVKT